VIDPSLNEEVRVTAIATGFEGFELLARRPAEVRRRSRQRAEISFDDRERRELEVSEDEIDVPSFLREQ
jgi:cell division protein FtsZ